MKKLFEIILVLSVLSALLFPGLALADDVSDSTAAITTPVLWDIGDFAWNVPFKNANAVALYEMQSKKTMAGLESSFASVNTVFAGKTGKINLNLGGVTSFDGLGTPYLSADYYYAFVNPVIPIDSLAVGPFFGDNFRGQYSVLYGLKAAAKFW